MDYPGYPSNEYSAGQDPSYPPYPTPSGYGMPEMMPPQPFQPPQVSPMYPTPGYPPMGGPPGYMPQPMAAAPGGYPSVGFMPQPMGPPPVGHGPPPAAYMHPPEVYPPHNPYGPPAPMPQAFGMVQPPPAMPYASIYPEPNITMMSPHPCAPLPEMIAHIKVEEHKEEKKENEGTIHPHHPFEPKADAEVLKKAMKGFGTNEKVIIETLTTRSCEQRMKIAEEYKSMHGKDLTSSLKKELAGDFETAVVALMTPRPLFLARALHSAMRGSGTKDRVLVEIICTATNSEIHAIDEAYQKEYGHSLESAVKKDTSGDYQKLLVALTMGHREEGSHVNEEKAVEDAEKLYKAGEKKAGTNESPFITILVKENYAQLRHMFEAYEKIAHHSFEDGLKKEMSGNFLDGLQAIVDSAKNLPKFFAKQLHAAFNNSGTRDHSLIRIVVSRSEIDLKLIKEAYQKEYNNSLSKAVSSETSGDYKKVLLAIIK